MKKPLTYECCIELIELLTAEVEQKKQEKEALQKEMHTLSERYEAQIDQLKKIIKWYETT
jgi:FtsZ-binding cell division protein ZapB